MTTFKVLHKYLPEEKETHIYYNKVDKVWIMESNIPKHFNKALKSGWELISKGVYEDGTVCTMQLSAAERAITIRTPLKRKSNNSGFKAKNSDFNEDF